MVKFKLDIAPEYDFDLIGLSCHQPDYKLSWNLNQLLGIELQKKQDASLKVKNKPSSHSYFSFEDEEDFMKLELIKNKGLPKHLIANYQSVDYFLKLNNNSQYNLDDLVRKIRKLDCILTATIIAPEDLKDAENLIFD